MMRRSSLHGALSAACGVWMALYSLVVTTARPCAMHGGGMAMAPALAAAPQGHAHHHGAPAPAHECTCGDDCGAVPSVAPLAAAPQLARVGLVVQPAPRMAAHEARAPQSRLRLLPWANGPPALGAA